MVNILSWIRNKYAAWKQRRTEERTSTEITRLLEEIKNTLDARGYSLSSRYRIEKTDSTPDQDTYVITYYFRKQVNIFPNIPSNGIFNKRHVLRFTVITKPDRVQLCAELRHLLNWTKQLPDMNSDEFWLQIRRKMREEESMRVLC